MKVMWVKALDHAGDAGSLADSILEAVNDPAHSDVILPAYIACNIWDEVTCVAVVCDEDDPDDDTFWQLYILSGTPPDIGAVVV